MTFRQYAKHDLLHAWNLIDHIGRFIPAKSLKQLNAVELTVLALVAMLHDFGMYVDGCSTSGRRTISRAATSASAIQQKYNEEHDIEPATIIKSVDSDLVRMANLDYFEVPLPGHRAKLGLDENEDIDKAISRLTKEMKEAAKNLDFERAAEIRDKVRELKEVRIFV